MDPADEDDTEEISWGRFFLSGSLVMGNEEDGRLVAEALADPQADPARRVAAARAILFALMHFYPPEPLDEDQPTAAETRNYLAPFLRPIAEAGPRLLEAARRPAEGAGDAVGDARTPDEWERTIRMAALMAATDAGDAATFAKAVDIAGDDGELYARLVELAARHEPPLLPTDVAALRPTLDRLRALLVASGRDENDAIAVSVAEAIAAIGAPAGGLADELVRLPKERRAPDEMPETDLSLSVEKAMELVGPAATPHLLPLFKDADPRIRRRAVEALAEVYGTFPFFIERPRQAPPHVVDAVVALTQDPDESVREAAERAHWSMTSTDGREDR